MLKQIILHHSGSTLDGKQWESINNWHRMRRFPRSKLGFWIGYQWICEKDGSIGQYRLDTEMGAHTNVKGKDYNDTAIGICIAGDFTKEMPTKRQLSSLIRLVGNLQGKYGIQDILEHRDVKNTACPGMDFKSLIPDPPAYHVKPGAKIILRAIERAKKRFHGPVLQRLLARLERRLENL